MKKVFLSIHVKSYYLTLQSSSLVSQAFTWMNEAAKGLNDEICCSPDSQIIPTCFLQVCNANKYPKNLLLGCQIF
jgi:hypothetical protein